MPLHGKIVVLKRSGGDGTEFPLTASCMFGRKPDCDIRIQLPQVSKEHCKIDLNENKEVILTNLSSVNPTRVNGEALQQSERLKHGDVITIIDRSFRFEYPPAPTPKKASKRETTVETPKIIQDQRLGDTVTGGTADKRILEVSTDPHLKDGTNQDNIQRSLEKTTEVDSKEDGSLLQSNSTSPFSDLYQMIKKSLDVKTPRRPSSNKLQTAPSRFCTPKPTAVRENGENAATVASGAHETHVETKGTSGVTPKSVNKQRRSSLVRAVDTDGASPSQASQRFTVDEVIEQVACQPTKSPPRRRSKEATPGKPVTTANAAEQKTSPVKRTSTKRKSGELGSDLPTPKKKKKRVSFGGYLSPELFDKKLPPDSPLRRGATPRRSLCLLKPQQSLLRRASVIGLLRENEEEHPKKSATSPGKKSRSPSPKASSPAKKSPKVKSPSPKATSPRSQTPKAKSPSPKATSPRSQTPKAKSPSPKATSPRNQTPKAKSPSPKATSPRNQTPKAKSPSPKATSPRSQTPKAKTPSPRATSPGKTAPKSRSPSPKTPFVKKETPSEKKRASQSCPTPQEHVKTPLNQHVQTPTVEGRFSVSRINTPSPVVEEAATHPVTPKIPLKRKSLKSTTRKTPCLARSAVKALHRLSGISRASLKAKNSWADIVKFGQTKIQVSAPAKTTVPKRTTKKTLPKPKTPARKLTGHGSTGHADSPVTIVVGRALKQRVVHPTAAAPRVVVRAALMTKNMKMDEDLTGISEMFKTPRNEQKRKSGVTEADVTKTPVVVLDPSEVDPSVLDTPEETGEMMVSPLTVASAVKGRRYNSEAVKRLLSEVQQSPVVADTSSPDVDTNSSEQQRADPTAILTLEQELPERIMTSPRQPDRPVDDLREKLPVTPEQKPEQQECLTGVKRVMKTPKEKAEAVEDIRGALLKTPKQKLEQRECLTGVKRIMKTPKEKTDPVEDIRGKLLMTPKQKPEQPECLTGVKRIFEIPKWEDEPVEDLHESPTDMTADAPEELVKDTPDLSEVPPTSAQDNLKEEKTPRQKAAPVEDMFGIDRLMKTPKEKGEPVEENFGIKRLMRSPRLRGHPPVEDFEGLQELMEVEDQTQAGCVFDPAGEHALCVQSDEGPSDVVHQEEGDAKDIVDQMEVTNEQDPCGTEEPEENVPEEHVPPQEMEMDTTAADLKKPPLGQKMQVEPKAAEVQQEAAEPSEDAAVPAPVRGRRGKRTEAAAPPAARQTTRSRKPAELKDTELPQEETAPPKPRRGRPPKKASDPSETVAEPEKDQILPVDEEPAVTAVKTRRGRTTRKEADKSKAVSEHQDVSREPLKDVLQADITPGDASGVSGEQQEVAPSEGDDSEPPAALETLPDTLPEEESEGPAVAVSAVAPKKRGRRDTRVEPPAAEAAAVPAPVRGRRGTRAATPAPPAVRQTRGRNAKSQAVASDDQAEKTVLMEIPAEVVDQETAENNSQEEPSAEGAPVKPTRGRKPKRTPDEPSQPEQEKHVSEQDLAANDEPDQPGAPIAKPRRGRKTNPPVDACTETSQQSQAPVRAKRGRTAPQEEEKPAELQEPVKRARRTRQAEQEPAQAPVEVLIPDAVGVPLEPEKTGDQTTTAAKPRRGRKAKQDAESVTPVEPTETQEVPVPDVLADKPKRGRRKQADVVEEQEPLGVKTSVESEASQALPAKRTRRGAAPSSEESREEAPELVRKGRRAATRPTADESTVSTELPDLTESVKETSQRSVKWKAEVDVRLIPKVTPVRAVRGRKASLEQHDPESNSVSKKASKPEEEKLSDDVVESQPAKRARRGSKVADVKAESTDKKSDDVAADQTEPQPKTRRGRSAKK